MWGSSCVLPPSLVQLVAQEVNVDRTCTACGVTKPQSDFPVNNGRPRGKCRVCFNAAVPRRLTTRLTKREEKVPYPTHLRREHYRETLHRLERLGIASPEFTKAALDRVEDLEIT